jgi:hypothetical protein
MKKVSIVVLILVLVGIVVYYFSDTESHAFTADIDGVSFESGASYATYNDGWLNVVTAQRNSEGYKIIDIRLHCSSTGSTTLNSDDPERDGGASYAFGKTKDRLTMFATTSSATGRVTISVLDTKAEQVSGTFEFRAIQIVPAGSRVVKVTGSFQDVPIR